MARYDDRTLKRTHGTKENQVMGASEKLLIPGRELFQSLEVYLSRSGYEEIMAASSAADQPDGPQAGTPDD
jgi:hypothetical protein